MDSFTYHSFELYTTNMFSPLSRTYFSIDSSLNTSVFNPVLIVAQNPLEIDTVETAKEAVTLHKVQTPTIKIYLIYHQKVTYIL